MKKTIFTGSGVAIVTPMNDDLSVNYDVLSQLIEFQIENQTDALIICGTTGETSTFTDEEHVKVMAYAVEKVNKRIPVVAGVGSNDTNYAMWLTKEAKSIGADALLHVTPYYNKTSQQGLIRHFLTIAELTDLPIILYNVPSRTGMSISPNTYFELSKHQNIVATKEASGDVSAIAKTKALCGDDLDIYSGNDDQIIPLMSLGGKGVISVLANILPKETHDICSMFLEGNINGALELQIKLLELINSLFIDVNPIPIKEALNILGFEAGKCRMPLIEMNEVDRIKLYTIMENLGMIK